MASLKVVRVHRKQKKNGTAPLALRITVDRKTRFQYLGHFIGRSDWDETKQRAKRSYPNAARLNQFLLKKVAEANEHIINAGLQEKKLSSEGLKKQVSGKASSLSFFEAAEQRIQQKHDEGVFSVSRAERSILNNIRKFHKQDDLAFLEITQDFLRKFKTFCKNRLGQSKRTTTNQLIPQLIGQNINIEHEPSR